MVFDPSVNCVVSAIFSASVNAGPNNSQSLFPVNVQPPLIVEQGPNLQHLERIFKLPNSERQFLEVPYFEQSSIVSSFTDNTSITIVSGNTTSTANTTAYYALYGWANINATETSTPQTIYRTPGTFKNLFIRLGSNSVSLATTFNFRKNLANANQTVSVASAATGIFEDTVNTDTIISGDKVDWQAVPGSGSTGTFQLAIASLLFSPSSLNNTVTRLVNAGALTNTTTASATNYFPMAGSNAMTATETSAQCIQEKAGTYKNMAVNITSNTSTTTQTFTLRKNAASVTNTISVGASTTGILEDLTHTDAVVAADKMAVMFVTGLATVNISIRSIGIDFVSTSSISQIIDGDPTNAGFGANQTNYLFLGGMIAFAAGATESWTQLKLRKGYTFSFLSCDVSTNTVTATSTLTFRKNAVNGNQTLSIGASTSGFFTDSTNTDITTSTDLVDLQLITGATGTTLTLVNTSIWSLASTLYIRGPLQEDEAIHIVESTPMPQILTIRKVVEALSLVESILRNIIPKLIGETVSLVESILRKAKPKVTNETLSLTESVKKKAFKVLTETLSLVESKVRKPIPKVAGETISLTESVKRKAVRAVVEALSLVESKVRKVIPKITGETLSLSESIKRKMTRPITETLSLVESKLRKVIPKIASQTLTLAEAVKKKAIKPLTETLTLTESKIRKPIPHIAGETISLVESIKKKATKAVTEALGLAESILRKPKPKVTGETISLVETKLRRVKPYVVETITLVESVKKKAFKVVTESVTFTESKIRKVIPKITSETVSLVESILRKVKRPISEAVSLVESILRIVKRIKSETLTLTESIAAHKLFKRAISEAITLTESTIRKARRPVAEALTLTESILRKIKRSLSESIILSESILRKAKRPVIETISLVESIKKKAFKVISDNLTLTETKLRKVIPKITNETISLAETIRRKVIRPVTDETISLSEHISAFLVGSGKHITEAISLVETKVRKVIPYIGIQIYMVFVDESLTLAESIRRNKKHSITESLRLTESFVRKINRHAILESLTLTENIIRKRFVRIAETLHTTEILKVGGQFVIMINETLTLTETKLRKVKPKTILESIVLTESKLIKTIRNISDTLGLTESIRRKLVRFVTNETLTLTENHIHRITGHGRHVFSSIGGRIRSLISGYRNNIKYTVNINESLTLQESVKIEESGPSFSWKFSPWRRKR